MLEDMPFRKPLLPHPRTARTVLLVLLAIYGVACGLQTVADFDLGWQMAESRHLFGSPLFPSVEALSYTAHGAPWLYPPLAGLVFRAMFGLGRYAAISWLALACTLLTVATIARGSRWPTLALLLLATPVLGRQMIPRSGMFSIPLAAAFVCVLFAHRTGKGRGALWLLPPLMVLWVNLHTGFIAGLALLLAYAAAELVDALQPSQRHAALGRLRTAALPMLATAAATLLNPWGPRMYTAIAAQERISPQQARLVLELAPLTRQFTWSPLHPILSIGTIWWLLGLCAVAAALLAMRRQFGLALFLAAGMAACIGSARSQGVFLPLGCVLAGYAFAEYARWPRWATAPRVQVVALLAVAACVAASTVAVTTDREALAERSITTFGAGTSWWIPQDAAAFVEQHNLPGELFSTFNLSSYLTWRLGPRYRDFADGRYLPFGDALVTEQMQLTATPLDADAWTRAAERYGIRTVLFPISRFYGVEALPLQQDCASRKWAPVYLDPTAVIFVRRDALPAGVKPIDCATEPLASRAGSRIARYQGFANAAVIEFLLGRNGDAERSVAQAAQLAPHGKSLDDSLALLRGQLQMAAGDTAGAEQWFRAALHLHESDGAWYQLGLLYASEQRYPLAIRALQRAAKLSDAPNLAIDTATARAQLLTGQTTEALATLQQAGPLATIPEAKASLSELQAIAYAQLPDWPAAIAAQKQATDATPHNAHRWQVLAAMYAAVGQSDQAAQAQAQASRTR